MRLLEVDEAANHIRELVDPDANIIWGSAFNPELEGRIRVSVVATGIDASAENRAAPAEQPRVFSFSTPRRSTSAEPAPAPSFAAEPEIAAEPAPEPIVPAPAPQAYNPAPAPAPAPAAPEADELLLGAEAMVPEPAPAPAPAAPAAEAPAGRRRWLTGGDEDAGEARPARTKSGGTLFERMASASRGAKAGEDDEKDPLDIPRFLRSQNNQ
jgi:cell division protein FtsZ